MPWLLLIQWAARFLKIAAPYLIIGGLVLGAIWYVGSLKGEAQDARANESIARSNAEAQAAAVVELGKQRDRVEKAAHERELAYRTIEKRLAQSRSGILAARKADPTEQAWADTPHPAAVGERLRAR
jgi:hypothetical protein